MSDSVQPHRRQPTRLPRPWDSPGKNTGVGCHFLQCMKVKVKALSRVQLLATPWTVAYQAPLSMGFSRQEYWGGVPLPSPKCVLSPLCRDTRPWSIAVVKLHLILGVHKQECLQEKINIMIFLLLLQYSCHVKNNVRNGG